MNHMRTLANLTKMSIINLKTSHHGRGSVVIPENSLSRSGSGRFGDCSSSDVDLKKHEIYYRHLFI